MKPIRIFISGHDHPDMPKLRAMSEQSPTDNAQWLPRVWKWAILACNIQNDRSY